ncbi:MAG: hypothetical protein J7K39_11840 [Bacteroidales bacterium]|nr:hypothetical protein [Bacteroidales bacterium]
MQKKALFLMFAFLVATFVFQPIYAQQQLRIGTDIPLLYGIAYKYSPEKGIGGGLKAGILTEPHSSIILAAMEALGTESAIVDIIRDGFKMGMVLDGSASWHWNKNYAGANLVYINLSAGKAPLDVIDGNYDLDLEYSPILTSLLGQETMQINLNSCLMQVGIHYGRRIPLKDKLELQLEFGVTKNIGSTNNFSSDFPYPLTVYNAIDEDLQEAYRKYAIIPTLGVYLVYNI